MDLNLEASFATADVRPVAAPALWGAGWTFHIARIGCSSYVAYQRERWKKSGLQKQFQQAALAEGMTKDPEIRKEVTLRAIEHIDMDAMVDNDGVAHHLIRNIEGLRDREGVAIGYSPELGVKLLAQTDPVPIEKKDETTGETTTSWLPVGQLIRDWVIEQASDGEAYRGKWLEAAGKNSEARSAGSSA